MISRLNHNEPNPFDHYFVVTKLGWALKRPCLRAAFYQVFVCTGSKESNWRLILRWGQPLTRKWDPVETSPRCWNPNYILYNLGVVLVTFSDLIVQELWHTLRQGYLRAILLCLKLKEGSLLSCGPPCGSYVFINRYTSGRSKWRPFGLASIRQYVREANVKLSCKCPFICISYQVQLTKEKNIFFGHQWSKDNNSHGDALVLSDGKVLLRGHRTTGNQLHDGFSLHQILCKMPQEHPWPTWLDSGTVVRCLFSLWWEVTISR